MFAKSDDLDLSSVARHLFQWLTKRLPVRRGHDKRRESLLAPQFDVLEHVAIDVAVLVDLGLGEDGKSPVTQCFYPRSDHVSAAWRDIGEDRGLGFDHHTRAVAADLCGTCQKPTTKCVEPGTFQGCGAAPQNRAQAHVEVRCVPYQQDAPGSW